MVGILPKPTHHPEYDHCCKCGKPTNGSWFSTAQELVREKKVYCGDCMEFGGKWNPKNPTYGMDKNTKK